ncbi:MAG: hypothetical protein A3C85_02755 [Candidatus Doudnabacteria bacterium RIFCSPHIGHO2_02_FULL_48_21]|uniref:Phosphatidic acid phosphatase type 2/haloperoxidase domain-containing protein n=1 Tax=Candidatus Doudnabacteria bacterium RIFCSPLOWO2_02_FULL_48_13 TaxID=1817845 RepID=A0A1F5Q9J2_9BACT|nr:MAG: hypothetical protein A3K05_03490 [Candidatus Doudnabacteria bacterium RIFCSPHIGHO2_01_48_18]OGE79499.1 MAG: hypothetical protein A2668_00140 [Candidatus Doudnabacteria bacterium RIFCSPHIGHO2_01_FULL_48_180]OGE91332.1 MAG: hypothetical protein A3F44_03415 [Candidatus Doudnabacteria bacterium RIFCSPHIGHO2_12_FULL_47_25]OGE92877.1 MAG: hypothetical protein A3C85_02755 [Candidatus Doudnabacteria bacterium RIFCSPHIGHO2_02_FULL_48_21]OGE96663.1 MAG: hypothetical protein A3A83_01690 [Candidatu
MAQYSLPAGCNTPTGRCWIYFYDKKYGIIIFAGAAFLSIARVYLGAHYPTDVLAGAAVGVGSAYIISKLFSRYFRY